MTSAETLTELLRRNRLLAEHIDGIIQKQPAPDIAQAILRHVVRHGNMGTYINLIPSYLEVHEETAIPIVYSLERSGLVVVRKKTDSKLDEAVPTEDGKAYACSNVDLKLPDTPHWENLTRDEAMRLLKTAEPHVTWRYEKTYEITAAQLEPLKERIHRAIDYWQGIEKDFVRKFLKLPEGASFYIGNYAVKGDPMRHPDYGSRESGSVSVQMPYRTLEEAFDADVDNISGNCRIMVVRKNDKPRELFPGWIKLYKSQNGYDAYCNAMLGAGSDVWDLPVKCQNESIEKLRALFGAVAGILPEKHRIRT